MPNRKRSMGRSAIPEVKCAHCFRSAFLFKFKESSYPYSRNYGPVWKCIACNAWVGCHKGTEEPLGTPANAILRKARQQVHSVFDPLWRNKHVRRGKAYELLAKMMGLAPEQAHIGMFDLQQCEKANQIFFQILMEKENEY